MIIIWNILNILLDVVIKKPKRNIRFCILEIVNKTIQCQRVLQQDITLNIKIQSFLEYQKAVLEYISKDYDNKDIWKSVMLQSKDKK